MEKNEDASLYEGAMRNLSCKNTIDELLRSLRPFSSQEKALRPEGLGHDINSELFFKNEKLDLIIVSPEDPIVDQAYTLLTDFFVRGELVSKGALVRKMHGLTKHFEPRAQYRLFIVKNKSKIVGARIIEQIPHLDKNLSNTGKNILYAIYIAVDKKYQGGTGIAKQLYISSLIDSVIEAEKNGKDFDAIVAECSDATENLQNSVGLKRVYFKGKKKLTELNFRQPHLHFNPMTGEPTLPEGEENKEHFMMGLFDKRFITKIDLEDCVRSLLRQYRSNKIRIDFQGDKAFERYNNYFDSLENEILSQIHKSGKLVLLSKQERLLYQLRHGDDSVITHKPEEGLD